MNAVISEPESWRGALDDAVAGYAAAMQSVREHLHAHPEPSGQEVATTEYVKEQLADRDLEIRVGPDARGLWVEPKGLGDTPRIGLRADMDALRVQDGKSAAYCSTVPGIMHACGHDGHVAALLGAVWALDDCGKSGALPRPVPWRAVFQPAEETNRGALEMVAAGAVDGMAGILGLHLDPSRDAGTVGVRSGTFTADCVEVRVRIQGRGGHAARPHESLDPIATAAQFISSVYLFVPRAADSHDPVVVSFGEIHGGNTPNAIPDEVQLRGTMRTLHSASREKAKQHLQQLGRGLAQASDTTITMEFIEGPPAVVNDPSLGALIEGTAVDLLGREAVQTIATPSMGGEDFANYLDRVPGAMFRLGCARPGTKAPPLHSPQFDLDPAALPVGARIFAQAAARWACTQG